MQLLWGTNYRKTQLPAVLFTTHFISYGIHSLISYLMGNPNLLYESIFLILYA